MVKKDIAILNPNAHIAIVTLWTKKEDILKLIPSNLKHTIFCIGTLYTKRGINFLLHTLAENPQVNTLIVYGKDLSGSGDALIRFFQLGEVDFNLYWSIDEISEILRTTRVIDLRSAYEKGDISRLLEVIKREHIILQFKENEIPRRRKIKLMLREPQATSFDLPTTSFMLYDNELFPLWVKILHYVATYGIVKPTEYGTRAKEVFCLGATLTLYGSSVRLDERFFKYFDKDAFNNFTESLFTAIKPASIEYTYGERILMHSHGGNQLKTFLEKLKARPHTRRAVIDLWYHEKDVKSEHPPCLILIQGLVEGEYYNQVAYFRSNDMFRAWPIDAYGLVKLAEKIASELNLKVGIVATLSVSAHVYEYDFQLCEKVVKENEKLLTRFVPDPHGYVTFENNEVVHRCNDGTIIAKYNKDYHSIKKLAQLLTPTHAFWLGHSPCRNHIRVEGF